MKHNIIKSLVALALGAMLLTSCGKDNKDNEALIGKWTSTAQSYEITIDGRQNITEGYIYMEFTDDKVLVSDSRTDCLAEWHKYSLSEESGKQLLEIEGGCYKGRVFVVERLTSDELVLAPFSSGADWDFRYIMKKE
ncbi:MAG: hypothetical protein IKP34_07235 [Bacteroidales bacterium]|nr:hypothetical protein [Bacteroidales bacterium]